jgi:hypothetical protein
MYHNRSLMLMRLDYFGKKKCLKERFFLKWNGLPPAKKQQRIVYPFSSVLMLREIAWKSLCCCIAPVRMRKRSSPNPKALTEIMKLQRALIDKVMKCDPVMERSLKFKREIENASCRKQQNK